MTKFEMIYMAAAMFQAGAYANSAGTSDGVLNDVRAVEFATQLFDEAERQTK